MCTKSSPSGADWDAQTLCTETIDESSAEHPSGDIKPSDEPRNCDEIACTCSGWTKLKDSSEGGGYKTIGLIAHTISDSKVPWAFYIGKEVEIRPGTSVEKQEGRSQKTKDYEKQPNPHQRDETSNKQNEGDKKLQSTHGTRSEALFEPGRLRQRINRRRGAVDRGKPSNLEKELGD
jgi:hypothetical protein